MFSMLPVERSSSNSTSLSRDSSSSARWEPMNPAPPVIEKRKTPPLASFSPVSEKNDSDEAMPYRGRSRARIRRPLTPDYFTESHSRRDVEPYLASMSDNSRFTRFRTPLPCNMVSSLLRNGTPHLCVSVK